jgi:hypothetical protein
VRVDGEQLLFVSRIELVLDAATREASVRLTVPAAMLDLDVDAAAFVTAHAAAAGQDDPESCAHCGHSRAAHAQPGEHGCSACPSEGYAFDHYFDERA